MKTLWTVLAASALPLLVAGCDTDLIDHSVDAGVDVVADQDAGVDAGAGFDAGTDAGVDAGTDAGFDAGIGNIEVFVHGDLTAKTFTDGYAGQTPSAQVIGISRLDLMTSSTDPAPVTAFDHGDSVAMVDMIQAASTLAGRANSSGIPAGTYPYGRVLMTLALVTVDATAHLGALNPPGKLTITSALSDTTVGGTAWVKGKTEYSFLANGAATPQGFTGLAPPLPNGPGVSIVQEAHRTWLVFPFTAPFIINPADTSPQVATIHYEVYKSFRWQDQTSAGYATDVLDLNPIAMDAEPVKNFGATGYHTTSP